MTNYGAMGWRGYARVAGSFLPITACDLSEALQLIPSEGVHGGGVSSASGVLRSQINVALGRKITRGRISGEVFAGSGQAATAFKALLARALPLGNSSGTIDEGFTASAPIIICPGGGDGFKYPGSAADVGQPKACVSRFTITGRPDANITYDCEIISAGRENVGTTYAPSESSYSYESAGLTDDSNPLPFWAVGFNLTGSGETGDLGDQITEWSIDINHNTNELVTADGKQYAHDILQGIMEITGTFSYYSADGTFVNLLTNGAVMTLTLGSLTTLSSPYVAFAEQPIPMPGMNVPTTRRVSFRCLAQQSNPSLYYT